MLKANKLYENEVLENNFTYSVSALQRTIYGVISGFKIDETNTLEWCGIPYVKPPINDFIKLWF